MRQRQPLHFIDLAEWDSDRFIEVDRADIDAHDEADGLGTTEIVDQFAAFRDGNSFSRMRHCYRNKPIDMTASQEHHIDARTFFKPKSARGS